MNQQPSVRFGLCLSLLGLFAALSYGGACIHDWDAYLPPDGVTTVAAGGAGGGTGGIGGSGAVIVPGSCPIPGDGSEMVKLADTAGDAMCIQRTEVTRRRYEQWLVDLMNVGGAAGAGGVGGAGGAGGAGGMVMPGPECDWNVDFTPFADWPPMGLQLDEPVAYVDWCDARSYCTFYGMRLCGAVGGGSLAFDDFDDPDSSEWFNACTNRGQTQFPYGDQFDETICVAASTETEPVGSKTGCSSLDDVLDLSGNVFEWEDSCDDYTGASDQCRVRGGGFNGADETSLACNASSSQARNGTLVTVGFRCCATAGP